MVNRTIPFRTTTVLRNRYTRTDFPGQEFTNAGDGTVSGNIGVSDQQIGATNPSYKVLIAKGVDASGSYTRSYVEYTPMHISSSSWGYPLGLGNKTVTWDATCKGSVYYDPSVLIDTSLDSNLQAISLQRLKGRIKSASNQVNAVVPIVELRDLRRTIVSLANATSSVLLAAATLKKTRGASAAKAVANLWLTWSFGIKPMINDIQSISSAIDDLINGQERNVRLSGTASKSWTTSSANVSGAAPFMCVFSGHAQVYHTLSYRHYAGLRLNVRTANNYGVQSQLGLDLRSIPSVLWELTAFSWVVDYFTNVGAYLDDTFSTDASQTVYCGLSRKYEMNATLSGEIRTTQSYCFITGANVVPGHFRYVKFTRTPLGAIPSTSLRFKSVDEIGRGGLNKLANLVSVYAGTLKGFTPRGPFI